MPEKAPKVKPLKAVKFGDAFLEAILAELVTIRKGTVVMKRDVRAILKVLEKD